MTSPDDDYGQPSNNNNQNSININSGNQHNNYTRRISSNSTNPYSSSPGIEIRILMTSRDAGAVIGKEIILFNCNKKKQKKISISKAKEVHQYKNFVLIIHVQ